MTNHPLKILSFGAGAIGTYIGGSLALTGHEVVFVERPNIAKSLNERGLRLDLSLDTRRETSAADLLPASDLVFVNSLERALDYGPFDIAVFALKSYDTESALKDIALLADKMPPVLCLQNGVDNEPAIAEILGPENLISGTVTSAIGRRDAGDIVLEKLRGIGIANEHPLSERLVKAMNIAFLNAKLYESAADMKWSKMLTNLVGNATSAILDISPAEIFSRKDLYAFEMRMLREALAVMDAQNIKVVNLPGTPVNLLAFAAKGPAWLRPLAVKKLGGGRGGKMPSFHIDLHSGRDKSEVDYLNGAIARAGIKTNIPTPVNSLLNKTLLAMTEHKIPLEDYAKKPLKLLASV
ncbi:MAG: 2-dehydropantoate 2-reductase [Anaerolineae bacterium]|jgi:2-dehydropantoate 2-reductase|nr:2-dehydropantoate 2-reductase [Anaerolineae bacterium]MBT7073413.1 2-dehydropantoate 2-reductase [Anaerolineae bacterium]MBT7783222.1 2-dehydropantoate 2-reductase [Anaerolineae bacterium]